MDIINSDKNMNISFFWIKLNEFFLLLIKFYFENNLTAFQFTLL